MVIIFEIHEFFDLGLVVSVFYSSSRILKLERILNILLEVPNIISNKVSLLIFRRSHLLIILLISSIFFHVKTKYISTEYFIEAKS